MPIQYVRGACQRYAVRVAAYWGDGAGVAAHFLSLAFCALFSAAIFAAAASFSALRLSAASLRAACRSASSALASPPALAFSFIRAFIAAFS